MSRCWLITLFLICCLLSPLIQAQHRHPQAKPLHEVITKSQAILKLKFESYQPNKRLMQAKVLQVIEGDESLVGQSIIITKMFVLPRTITLKTEYTDPYGRLRMAYQRQELQEPVMYMLLSRKKISEKAPKNHFEIDSTKRISAVFPIVNEKAVRLTPGFSQRGNEIHTGYEFTTENELAYNLKIGKRVMTLSKKKQLTEQENLEAFQIISNPMINYTFAKALAKHLSYQQQHDLLRDEIEIEGPPIYHSSYRHRDDTLTPPQHSRLGALLEKLTPEKDPELLPTLQQLLEKRNLHSAQLIRRMGQTGEQAIPFLIQEMNYGVHTASAAQALADIGGDQAFKAMLEKMNYDLMARPIGYQPVVAPAFARAWPQAWTSWQQERQSDYQDTERLNDFMNLANTLIKQSDQKRR